MVAMRVDRELMLHNFTLRGSLQPQTLSENLIMSSSKRPAVDSPIDDNAKRSRIMSLPQIEPDSMSLRLHSLWDEVTILSVKELGWDLNDALQDLSLDQQAGLLRVILGSAPYSAGIHQVWLKLFDKELFDRASSSSPHLQTVLAAAWTSRSFRQIRSAGMSSISVMNYIIHLRRTQALFQQKPPPGYSDPAVEKGDLTGELFHSSLFQPNRTPLARVEAGLFNLTCAFPAAKHSFIAVSTAWVSPYSTNYHERPRDRIQNLHSDRPYSDFSNTVAVMQSAGTGKSRMVDEMATLIFTLPVNLREAEHPQSTSIVMLQ